MSGIFVSYRRDDTAGWAGRLYEHLVQGWGRGQVFMDIDAIAPGEDFREAIARTMATCDVVLVVIGPSWLNARDPGGNRRLEDETDAHRTEIVAALASEIRVIPVLVGGAAMPKVFELPAALKDLAYRNAAIIEDRRFVSDVAALEDTLRQQFTRSSPAPASVAAESNDVASTTKRWSQHGQGRTSGSVPGGATSQVATTHHGSPERAVTALPTALTVAGSLLVLVWGALMPRDWHPELWGIRVTAAGLLVVLSTVGLWSRQWKWVLAGGVCGVVGLALWILQLLSTGHSVDDLFSPSTDGIPNLVALVGAVLVLAAGFIGASRTESGQG